MLGRYINFNTYISKKKMVNENSQYIWRAPKLLDRLQRESTVENNGRVGSSGHAPWLSTLWRGRGAWWSLRMWLGRIEKLQSITQTCTKLTQSG
jgi:hypothetical protein